MEPGSREEASETEAWHATIAGVAVVTIPLDHYADLLDCRRIVAENNLRRGVILGAFGRVDRDPEVAVFLAENMAGRTLRELYTLVRDRFGTERAPSRSSIQRYRDRLRRR